MVFYLHICIILIGATLIVRESYAISTYFIRRQSSRFENKYKCNIQLYIIIIAMIEV